jgi:hypothetical protein
MTKPATPVLDGLAEREQAVEEARQRVDELVAEGRASKRDLDRAIAPLQDYYRALEAGEREPDADVESRLREAVAKAQATTAPQAVFNPRGETDHGLRLEMVNPEIEGKLAGARHKLAESEQEYEHYLRAHFDDLAVELAALGTDLAERCAPVAAHARKAHREWQALRDRWRPLVAVASFNWSDFPPAPFSATDVQPLMPRQLAHGEPIGGPSAPKKRKRRG